MKATLFATKREAEKYIQVNHQGREIEKSSLYDESDWVGSDRVMENFQWSGETECYNILDEDGNTIDRVAWWEDGDDTYEIWYGEDCVARVNDHPHAKAIFDDYVSREENKDEDDPDINIVEIVCNGMTIDSFCIACL